MKIGIDGRFWNESGVGRYIRNLVRELNQLDTKNDYILFVKDESSVKNPNSAKASMGEQELKKNWSVVETDIRWHTVEEQLRFPFILNSYNLDLVHFPYFSVPIFYNRPFVVTIHDLILHHFATGKATTLPAPLYHLKRLGYKLVMMQAVKKSQKILTVSEATKKEIIEHLHVPSKKIVVTYEGVDDTLKKSNSIDTKSTQEPFFLYVGNSYPHKNLERLFFAFSSLKDIRVKLYVVGQDDFFFRETKKLAEQGFRNPNILFKTNIDDEELSVLYSHALALVSPSLMEGFGLPLLEAMNLGCLVIASDIPSSREICHDAALYFNPLERGDLENVLEQVLTRSSSYNTLRKKGENRVKDFSWNKMANETLRTYESCLSLRSRQ